MNSNLIAEDTIVAVSTPPGSGGIAVVRLSGKDSLNLLKRIWKGKNLDSLVSHTAHLGKITMADGGILDEVVITFYKGPNSFTGEDVVEISCHGSRWIQKELVELLVRNGARPAGSGEFTQRAFMNGRLDLAQAEGIIDLISSTSKASHKMAMQQTNGKFSEYFNRLREQLIEFASLLELELDFSEEDVEFADRKRLLSLCDEVTDKIRHLVSSYSTGKVIKEGIPVVIAGEPNAGKSTLLNRLLDEDKAIVTDIPGTTRDVIEGTSEIDGVLFRFADTAGLHATDDTVEQIGIQRAEEKILNAAVMLWVVDITSDICSQMTMIEQRINQLPETRHIVVINKCDKVGSETKQNKDNSNNESGKDSAYENLDKTRTWNLRNRPGTMFVEISAKSDIDRIQNGVLKLERLLSEIGHELQGVGEDIIVSNARHYESLLRSEESMQRVKAGLDAGISGDFIAQDVRETLHHLSTITGAITTPDLLTSIFTRFCIGK